MNCRILIITGGTGGHLFPAQSLAKKLCHKKEVELFFLGKGLSSNPFFDQESFQYQDISAAPLGFNLKAFKNVQNILKGIFQSLKIIKKYNPDLVIGFGSFYTFPSLVAAILLRKKIYLHEQNKVMGRVNRLLAPFSKKVFLSFPEKGKTKKKNVLVQMPLKWSEEKLIGKEKARMKLNLDPHLKTILVYGGSQGAQKINELFLDAIKLLPNFSFQVIHMMGKNDDLEKAQELYNKLNIRVYLKTFDPNMHLLMEASNFMISRAGAMTIFEMIQFQIPAILIPYPYAKGHQEFNADFIEKEVQGGLKISQKYLTKDLLSRCIVSFLNNESTEEYQRHIESFKKKFQPPSIEEFLFKELKVNG